jgi:hypothetical protein
MTAAPGKAQARDAGTLGRYPVFAISFGAIFSVVYLFVMNYSWQLFTYYPAMGQWTLFGHPATVPAGTAAPAAMKWYGFVATAAIVAFVVGLIASLIPENLLRRFWWPGLIWLVPTCAMLVVLYLILVVGD